MEWAFIPMIFIAAVQSATPLLIAGLGELIVEKSGVLNLGIEGMILVGAVFAFIVASISGNFWLAAAAGAGAGISMAALFALLTVFLRANQVACGLALTIFGGGFSAFVGLGYEGKALSSPPSHAVPLLADIPVLGEMLFNYQAPVYFVVLLVPLTIWFLSRTRAGLILRAVGENHHAAGKMGYPVLLIRFAAVLYGGALCGIAGAYLSVFYTPLWVQNMSAGRGWIVLALVVFASWRPWRLALGAFLFGFINITGFSLQALGVSITPQFLSMAPYVMTIIVLVIISLSLKRRGKTAGDTPLCLGQPFPLRT